MKLKSEKYPNIEYKKGEDIFLDPEETHLSFYLEVEEELTEKKKAMEIVGVMLDEIDALLEMVKDFLRKVLADEEHEYYEIVSEFMEFHRDDEEGIATELFPVEEPTALSFTQMVDYLKISRFGSMLDDESEQQVFVLDLSFDPEVTDEVLAISINLKKQIFDIAHES